ncbi:MAG: 3-dehydroquinate synthase [Flavobacteriaceae bacterium]|nr:3-dehydroquinate synthase [Flavobacteriaceae bacterium]
MKEIKANNYSIFFNDEGYIELYNHIQFENYSKIFIHLDNNTNTHCLKVFLKKIKKINYQTIISNPGEENKNIESTIFLWDKLSNNNGDRKSLIINLGGGVVGDMGGFVASTFKRGISYINMPTTLLSMVDASIGGKTGIDLGSLKNQIGTFCDPKMVIIDPLYLETLDKSELISGYAEVFKHSLISEKSFFEKLISQENSIDFKNLDTIKTSVKIKKKIVLLDKEELKERKALNFGHTLGHAIESHFLKNNQKLLHGEAIGIGIVLAAFISNKILDFPIDKLRTIKYHILKIFKRVDFKKSEIEKIIKLLIHDKKNSHGKINFILLKDIGKPMYDIEVENKLILESFNFYLS